MSEMQGSGRPTTGDKHHDQVHDVIEYLRTAAPGSIIVWYVQTFDQAQSIIKPILFRHLVGAAIGFEPKGQMVVRLSGDRTIHFMTPQFQKERGDTVRASTWLDSRYRYDDMVFESHPNTKTDLLPPDATLRQ